MFPEGANLKLGKVRMIINPGGVGQPRDGDPRASYALYDTEAGSVHHYRVEYDIRATQKKMEEQGLPTPLILRLSVGW
jgi:diadenosine tetraphosphatase ApaH/serine/threonine PP2A family protein phosphatase